MMRFSDEAWERTARLREAIHLLPFNTELAAGSLAPDRFRAYIVQDALYLGRFSRALAIAARRFAQLGLSCGISPQRCVVPPRVLQPRALQFRTVRFSPEPVNRHSRQNQDQTWPSVLRLVAQQLDFD